MNIFRQILRAPLTFLYFLYLKIEAFLPWTFLRFIFSFSKTKTCEKKTNFIVFIFFLNLVQSLVWSTREIDPLREIDDYCLYFDNQYGTRHPAFYRGKLSRVIFY